MAHSSPLPHVVVAGSQQASHQAGKSLSTHYAVAAAESSSVGNEIEKIPSKDNAITEICPEIIEAGNSSNLGITAPEGLLPATEPEPIGVFRFKDLAAEIRNRIYHFVLGPPQDPSICLTQIIDCHPFSASNDESDIEATFHTKSVKLNPKHKDPAWGVTHDVKSHDLSILLVSKQIYMEAFHVFYTTNCFSFTDTGLLYRFLKNIGYIRRQHLTMVYFLWRGPDAKEAFRLLKTCRRLRLVQFTVPCSHPPGYQALKEVRVEVAKARALVHFAPAPSTIINLHDHNSCFGDYQCRCQCRPSCIPASDMDELEKAMMRSRRGQDLPDPGETFNLFKPKREHFKKSEDQDLLMQKASFDDFINRIEQQGRELKYLGRRNKLTEASLNQTLMGADVDEYFQDFADKLAADKRQIKKEAYWNAKVQAEKEAKEKEAREKKEAVEAKELEMERRRAARELKWKIAREAREHAKKIAKEARELKRTSREAKNREKMMARQVRAQKKAAREATARDRKATAKGMQKVEKNVAGASD